MNRGAELRKKFYKPEPIRFSRYLVFDWRAQKIKLSRELRRARCELVIIKRKLEAAEVIQDWKLKGEGDG